MNTLVNTVQPGGWSVVGRLRCVGALNGITAKCATLRNRVSAAQRVILILREVSGGGLEPAVAWCHEQAICATVQVKVGMGCQLLPVRTG